MGQKHRTSWAQTSVLSMQNLRTLWQRSPMFPVFRPKMAQKFPFSDFAIFWSEAGHGGFRCPSRPVNDVVREAGCIRKRTLENIAHLSVFFMNPWHSGYNCFVVHRLCKNRLTSFVGAGIRAYRAALHVHILPEAAGMSLNHAGKLIKIAFLSSLACRNATKPASFIRPV